MGSTWKMRRPTEDLNLFAEGYRVNRSVALGWLEWQGLAVSLEFLIEREVVRADAATAHVIWPHTFRGDVVALDVEYRLGQSAAPDDDGWEFELGAWARPPGGVLSP